MFEEVSTSVASSRTCGNIIQVMKFNWIEFLGEHICYKKDASACLPSRSLLYFLILTKHICIPISKATVLPREYLLYSEDSHPFFYMCSFTHFSVSHSLFCSFPSSSCSPGHFTFSLTYNQKSSEHRWYLCLLSAMEVWLWHSTISIRKTRSSRVLWLLSQKNADFWS